MNRRLKRQLEESGYLHGGMMETPGDGAQARWELKPVLDGQNILLAERLEELRLVGPGFLSARPDGGRERGPCVCVEHTTERPVQNAKGRAYTTTELFIPFDHEDWSEFNRLSLWVYAEAEGGVNNHVSFAIHNAGPVVNPVPGRFEGWTAPTLPTGRWTRVLWEFPNICRSDVTAISMCMHASGTPYPGKPRIRYYLDDLRLERVEAEHDKGFDLRGGAVAYCHSGYRAKLPKRALVQHHGGCFQLRDEAGQTVFEGESSPGQNGFSVLDFTAFTREGWYTLHVDGMSTKPFPIGGEAYLSAAWKTLNYFFVARCGCSVPGVHAQCHLDVMSVHPDGRKQCVAGGWHDAGDLTQDGRNTMECVLAMLDLAQAAHSAQPALSARAMEEARWGLDWVMRTRWGDGYRHCGRIISVWTDNVIGGTDDIETMAEVRPYDNLLSAEMFARAAMAMRESDPPYAALCARYAREDFRFGVEWMHRAPKQSFSFATPVQLSAQAALSAAMLFEATGRPDDLAAAAGHARGVMRCQQQDVPKGFRLPLSGYFYEDATHAREQNYFHRSYEQVPIQALCALYRLAPEHPDAPRWRLSLERYAGYLRAIADFTPYGLMASGVYELDNAEFSNMYHEGDRSAGAPSMEEYNAQVKNGIQLDETHYLRIFPVSYQFRGFHAPLIGKALAALYLADALGDASLRPLAARQMEWMLGVNPFALSSVFGEGYDYHPLYTGLLPQIVGAVPVGFETFENEDIPYYPVQNLPTYKEIWVHTTCRLMKAIAGLGFENA